MKFFHSSLRLSKQQVSAVENKLDSVLTELSLRETNFHVGSGLGGNPLQWFTLADTKHICSDIDSYYYRDGSIYWGLSFLERSSKVEIRKALDYMEPAIRNNSPYVGTYGYLFSQAKLVGFKELYYRDTTKFRDIETALLTGQVFGIMGASRMEQMIFACMLCSLISDELDKAGITSKVQNAARVLSGFESDIILYSVRTQISLNRIIGFTLDEHPSFQEMFDWVNKKV